MEQLRFEDTESGETFEGFGRMLAESRIFGKNYSEARARFYKIENRRRTATIPDFLLVGVLAPDEVMLEKFNDAFHFASWMRLMIQEDLREPGGNVLFLAMQKIIRDASANSNELYQVRMNLIEFRQILTGKIQFPEPDPEPEPMPIPAVKRKPGNGMPFFPWI